MAKTNVKRKSDKHLEDHLKALTTPKRKRAAKKKAVKRGRTDE